MAYINIAHHGSAAGRIGTFLRDAADHLARRRVFKTTLRELQSLSNRELVDLGIRRSELRRIAYEAAYKQG